MEAVEAHDKIDSILGRAGIPYEVFETVYEGIGKLIYKLWDIYDPAIDSFSDYEDRVVRLYPLIMFIGQASEDELNLYISSHPWIPIDSKTSRFISDSKQGYIDDGYIAVRVIYEFLRQQISERCGSVPC